MWPIVTYGVAWFVCLSVCHDREPCRNGWTDWDAIWAVDSGGPKKACCRLGVHIDYDWTLHVRQWCGLSVKLRWPLVVLFFIVSIAVADKAITRVTACLEMSGDLTAVRKESGKNRVRKKLFVADFMYDLHQCLLDSCRPCTSDSRILLLITSSQSSAIRVLTEEICWLFNEYSQLIKWKCLYEMSLNGSLFVCFVCMCYKKARICYIRCSGMASINEG